MDIYWILWASDNDNVLFNFVISAILFFLLLILGISSSRGLFFIVEMKYFFMNSISSSIEGNIFVLCKILLKNASI